MKENCAKAERKQFNKSLVEGPPYRGMQKILIYLYYKRYRVGCLDSELPPFGVKKDEPHPKFRRAFPSLQYGSPPGYKR